MGWRLDELAHAGRENLDPGHVARYDDKEDAQAAAEVALLRDHGLGPGAHVVEFGAGTGQFTVAAAPACERIVAVDVSEPMLERCGFEIVAAERDGVLARYLLRSHPLP